MPREQRICQLLAVDGVQERPPELQIRYGGRASVEKLRVDRDRIRRSELDLSLPPLTHDVDRLLDRQRLAEGELDRPGQDVRRHSRRVGDEPYFDDIDLRSSQHEVVVRLEHQVASPDEISESVGTGSHERVVPVGELSEAHLVLCERLLQQVLGKGRRVLASAKHEVGLDVRSLPGDLDGVKVGGLNRLDQAVGGIGELRQLAVLANLRREQQVLGG